MKIIFILIFFFTKSKQNMYKKEKGLLKQFLCELDKNYLLTIYSDIVACLQ